MIFDRFWKFHDKNKIFLNISKDYFFEKVNFVLLQFFKLDNISSVKDAKVLW